MQIYVYSSNIACNGKMLGTTHISINNRMEKLIFVYKLETNKGKEMNEPCELEILGM